MENHGEESSRGKRSGKTRPPSGSFRMILKDSDWIDLTLMALGTMGCFADGLTLSLIMVILSHMMNGYGMSSFGPADINKFTLYLIYIAAAMSFGSFLEGFCWPRTAERQTARLGRKYLQAVLRQDVGFFDTTQDTSITSQVVASISTDMHTIQDILTEKLANFIMNISMFIMALLAALYLCQKLVIVAIPALLLLIVPTIVYGKLLQKNGAKIYKAYAVAGGIVEQALSSIRTVDSYVGEERTAKSYRTALQPTLELGIKQGLMKGMAIGSIGFTYAVWAFQAWYGSILVTKKGVKGGDVFSAGVCIVFGGLALGGALANVRYFTEANVAAARIFEMIQRVPSIDSADQKGKVIPDVKGELEFNNIDFAYPSRPDSLVLRNFNLRVMASRAVGLVGGSGSGKSTIINLLERFYDPLKGEILLDGFEIKSLQLKWLRSQMGLVSQEPVLFATSIKENILFGKEDASMEDIIEAAKSANAHDFISQLPNGYDSLVGQLGNQMSGGQKQRISIARALLRDPKILLLDEATSALDSHSEKAVQEALNQASVGRTTLIIAHRLSTLCDADLIVVIQSGQVMESGSPEELMQNGGAYSEMVKQQRTCINDEVTQKTEEGDSSGSHETETSTVDVADKSILETSNHESKNEQNEEDHYSPPSLWNLMCMAAPEWKSTLLGCTGAILCGSIPPLHTFCIGALVSVYFIDDPGETRSETRKYCFAFLSFFVSSFIFNVIQHHFFAVMGESLTKRVRETLFGKILTFEMEWFDQENNSSGAVCARLATDATMVRTLVADRLSLLAQTISATTLAVTLAMASSWKLAIVALALQPVHIVAFYVRAKMMKSMSRKILKAQNKSSQLASEAVGNHRIITAFYSQEKVIKLYETTQLSSKKESHRQSWYAGFALLASQFFSTVNTALIFWYGGKLLFKGEIAPKHIFQTFFILSLTAKVVAEAGSMTSDLSKGTRALRSVFMILNRKSKMDPDDPEGIKPEKIKGDIEFKEVDFSYPTRPKQIILTRLNLRIDGGKVVALVGQSGCGKSTIIRLVERFYDPSNGSVEIDGIDCRLYNLRALRSQIALVNQEPTLFAGTIHENIAYAKENATEAEIVKAATIANAHEFISSLEDGYATYCGERGVQLSGGQKQRIALARAILKSPAVLLLDEATSALDIRSEKLVQDALESTMSGRTCVVVAHRLSTVQKSDKIVVLESGKVVEEGTHNELLAEGEKGAYFSLVKSQQLATMR